MVTSVNQADETALSGQPRSAGKASAYLAATALVLGNITGIFSSLDAIRTILIRWLSFEGLGIFLAVSKGFIIVCLEVAFFIAAYWFHRLFIRNNTAIAAILFWGACLLCTPAIAVLGARMVSTGTPIEVVSRQEQDFINRIWSQQADGGVNDGGIQWALSHPSDYQPWTTALALTGILSTRPQSAVDIDNARRALAYVERTRMPDQGWGYFPGNPRGVTEVISWVILANIYSLSPDNIGHLWPRGERDIALARLQRDFAEISVRQHSDGCFGPIRGTTDLAQARTYSTVMSLWAFSEARGNPLIRRQSWWNYDRAMRRAMQCLLRHVQRNSSGFIGWWPVPSIPNPSGAYPGLTGQAIFTLYRAGQHIDIVSGDRRFTEAVSQFLRTAESGVGRMPAVSARDVGENDRSHDGYRYIPGVTDFQVESSTFLWYPWTLAAVLEIAGDRSAEPSTRNRARRIASVLIARIGEAEHFASNDEAVYPMAEVVLAVSLYLASPQAHDGARE